MNPVTDPKQPDVVLPPTPIGKLVEETGVGVFDRQPYLSEPQALVHRKSHVQLSYFVYVYSPLLYFSQLKWAGILHGVQFLNAGQSCVPTIGAVAANLASKLKEVVSKLEQLLGKMCHCRPKGVIISPPSFNARFEAVLPERRSVYFEICRSGRSHL